MCAIEYRQSLYSHSRRDDRPLHRHGLEHLGSRSAADPTRNDDDCCALERLTDIDLLRAEAETQLEASEGIHGWRGLAAHDRYLDAVPRVGDAREYLRHEVRHGIIVR